jgi:hypothetical protein
MAEVNKVAVAAAMAKRPRVRFVIMGCISVVDVGRSKPVF